MALVQLMEHLEVPAERVQVALNDLDKHLAQRAAGMSGRPGGGANAS